jgi:hypothetical protein
MWRTVNLAGMAMAQALEERGQEGAVHMGTGFDYWYPGFMDHAHNFHNVAAFLTETGLYEHATQGVHERGEVDLKSSLSTGRRGRSARRFLNNRGRTVSTTGV